MPGGKRSASFSEGPDERSHPTNLLRVWLSVSAKAENMLLKFLRYKCVIKRSCFGGAFSFV